MQKAISRNVNPILFSTFVIRIQISTIAFMVIIYLNHHYCHHYHHCQCESWDAKFGWVLLNVNVFLYVDFLQSLWYHIDILRIKLGGLQQLSSFCYKWKQAKDQNASADADRGMQLLWNYILILDLLF